MNQEFEWVVQELCISIQCMISGKCLSILGGGEMDRQSSIIVLNEQDLTKGQLLDSTGGKCI